MDVTIYEADSLVDAPSGLIGSTPMIFRKLMNSAQAAVGFGVGKGWSDLYATIDMERARVGRTRVIAKNSVNPRWDESFHIYCAHMASNLVVSVKSNNAIGATLIGRARVPALDILQGRLIDRRIRLCNEEGLPLRGGGRVRLKLQFSGIPPPALTPAFQGVPYTFFKQKKGCRVTLYHDAHVPHSFNAALGGQVYRQHRYWENLFECILNARHLVYITGWSVYTGIRLIRDPKCQKPGGEQTLGELLKRKANEGVGVLLLVWDDRTSNRIVRKDGVMATHDQETLDYFANSKVRCTLCPRDPDNRMSIVQDMTIATMFTHHQKTVVVDAPSGSQRRSIVAFVGGIDLCDGRYDTPSHSLFTTLQDGSDHSRDFHQPNFPGACIEKGGPREPWHDIHSKLEGPVAWDVLYNFEQRWKKQADPNLLIPTEECISLPTPVTSENDVESWNVQLFRSIDGGAAFGFPEKPEEAARAGLVSGKDVIIDRSIQDAYINAIRRANNFIYIENQYFLGSSFSWKTDHRGNIDLPDIGALHLIPKELSLKIVKKIESGERFSVYVVVPMWPEGIPHTESVQAILDWQRRTMDMMYFDIAQALRTKQMYDVSPRDYLTFFCLGNREKKMGGEYVPPQRPENDTDYKRAQDNRRFMIYVHSKMMIVDDEYIIVGSANINQRSMDGARDSEIAMGAYQPHYLSTAGKAQRGQIHCFRMSLWYEHMGMLDNLFLQPQTLDCIRKVNTIAQNNWDLYVSKEFYHDLPAHLLTYPVLVTNDGNVGELPAFPNFPDTRARVMGTPSDRLPPILTT
jgi:phospholipase D1/2